MGSVIAWAECRNGHALTDKANVYITPDGWRRCRICKRMSDRRTRPERTPNRVYPALVVRPSKYRVWAEAVWDAMSEEDKRIVGYALGYTSLEQAVA